MGKAQGQSTKRQKLDRGTSKRASSNILAKGSFKTNDDDGGVESELGSEPEVQKSKDKGKAKEQPKKKKATLKDSSLPTSFKIVAGTYEKLLYGLDARVSVSSDADGPGSSGGSTKQKLEFTLKPIFAFPAHVSYIKAVAASPHGGKWLATGSADEIIKVWDLRRRKEVGGLMHHQGSITHLHFPSRSHLLSASEDGTLCLFHTRDWTVLRTMKGHKASVNAIAVHPSGKVALSVGKDKTLRMWDLMRGKGVASTKLGKEGEIVRWSTDGSMFVVQSGSTMDIYDTAMNLLHTISHSSRLHDVKFSSRATGQGEILLAGAEDKKLSIYAISPDPTAPPRIIAELLGHERRVKALQTISVQLPPLYHSTQKSTIIVCTASSDGRIRVFDLASLPVSGAGVVNGDSDNGKPVQIEPVAEYNTKGTRLTCLAVADGDAEHEEGGETRKRKREDEEDEGANERGVEGEREDGESIADGEDAEHEEEWGSLAEDEEEVEDESE
ncbi:hypothetical protein AX15_002858 [Amanita polypyramis BW_CC]|nr:hypothetical protein AX15_002858 [Amanita polypyramis BW_CC]